MKQVSFFCEDCGATIVMSVDYCGRVEICPQCGGHVDVPPADSAHIVEQQPESLRELPDRTAWPASWQIVVVLCLTVVPSQISSIRALVDPNGVSFLAYQCDLIARSLQMAVPLLGIIYLSKADWREFGIVRPRWAWDISFAVLIWMMASVSTSVAGAWADKWPWAKSIAAAPATVAPAATAGDFMAMLLGALAVGCAEELAIQGLLLTRLEQYLRSTWRAILIATVLFASCHLYQGSHAAIAIGVGGLVRACAFCILRRLWPLCLAHALADFVAWLPR